MEHKELIGKVLHFKQADYDHSVMQLTRKYFPAVLELKAEHERLFGKGSFNQEVYLDYIHNGATTIHKRLIEEQEKKIQNETPIVQEFARERYRPQINAQVSQLSQVRQRLDEAMNAANQAAAGMYSAFNMVLDMITIVDGSPSIDTDALRKMFEIRIDTEAQAIFYSKLSMIEKLWNECADFATDHGYDVRRFGFQQKNYGNGGFVREQSSYMDDKIGNLTIIPQSIQYIKG